MSNKALTWAFALEMKTGPKFVLVALADYADENNSCYPKFERIAEKTGQSARAISRHINDLAEAGFIEKVRQRYDDGNLGNYRFRLNLNAGSDALNGTSMDAKKQPHAKLATGSTTRQIVQKPHAKKCINHTPNWQDNNHQNNHQIEPSVKKAKLNGHFEHLRAKLKDELTPVTFANLSSKRELGRVQKLGADMEAVCAAIVSFYHDPAMRGRDPQYKPALDRVIRERQYEPLIGHKPNVKLCPAKMRELYHRHDTGKLTDTQLSAEIAKLKEGVAA